MGNSELSCSRSPHFTDKNPLETANLAFYGTNVVEGFGSGIVIATGDDTLMGHIAGLTSGLKKQKTPMKKEIKRFIIIIAVVALVQGFLFLIIAFATGRNLLMLT